MDIPGAGFYTGDPHFAQGDGEVSLTALEAPLRATVRLTVLKKEALQFLKQTVILLYSHLLKLKNTGFLLV